MFFFFKQKTSYELRISDWSSDVCSSDPAASIAVGSAIEARPEEFVDQIAMGAMDIDPVATDLHRGARAHGISGDAGVDLVGRHRLGHFDRIGRGKRRIEKSGHIESRRPHSFYMMVDHCERRVGGGIGRGTKYEMP